VGVGLCAFDETDSKSFYMVGMTGSAYIRAQRQNEAGADLGPGSESPTLAYANMAMQQADVIICVITVKRSGATLAFAIEPTTTTCSIVVYFALVSDHHLSQLGEEDDILYVLGEPRACLRNGRGRTGARWTHPFPK
jgi:hypothetical protein